MTDLDRLKAAEFEEGDSPPDTEAAPVPRMIVDVRPDPSPLAIYAQAIDKGISVADLHGLLDLHERIEATRIKAAYAADMAPCQAAMPNIVCDAFNPQTKSKYPKLETIVRKIKPIYTEHGFSLEFGEGKAEVAGEIRTTCDVTHREGYTKHFFKDLPTDGVGIKGNSNMTAIHGRLSSDTYAQTRLLKKIFNLTIVDDVTDDDGNLAGGVCSDEQIAMIRDLLGSLEKGGRPINQERWLKWLKCTAIEEIRAGDFQKAVLDLNQKRKEK